MRRSDRHEAPPCAPLLGRYQLGEPIAAGGMARVYAGSPLCDTGAPPLVAVKQMHPHLAANLRFVSMFVQEARVLTLLAHPNIVSVFDFEATDAGLYLVMEYVDGPDLLDVLSRCVERDRRIPPAIAVLIASQLLEALDYAHTVTRGGRPLAIVHRDVSPSNILLSWRGQVKLADFGIACAADTWYPAVGKYGYMSPEQLAGHRLDGRADVFAAGVVLAELLMCRRLFKAPSQRELFSMIARADTSRLDAYGDGLPPALLDICRRALARRRDDRFASAGDFRDALVDWTRASPERAGAAELAGFLESLDLRRKTAITSPP